MFLPAIGWACLLVTQQTQSAQNWKLETKETGTYSVELTWSLKNPGFEAAEWVLMAPVFPKLPNQVVQSQELKPGEVEKITEDSPQKRPFLRSRHLVKKSDPDYSPDSLNCQLTALVTLSSRKLVALPSRNPGNRSPFPETFAVGERKKYLRTSTLVDHEEPTFRQWLREEKLLRQPGENDMSVAKRLFLAVRTRFSLKIDPKSSRRASFTATKTEGDVGALHALFLAMCRSQGIPSRVLIGRLAKSTQLVTPRGGGAAQSNHQWYMRAEWWLDEVGWIPVDLLQNLGVDKTETQHLKWFGLDPGDLVVFHEDFDVILDPLVFPAKELEGVEGIAVWSLGKGKLGGQSITENWTVKKAQKPKNSGTSTPATKK